MKRKIVSLIIICATVGIIGGCSSTDANKEPLMKEKKETVVQMYNNLLSKYTELSNEYDELTGKIDNLKNNGELNPGVTKVGDGDGDLTLNSVNSQIQFDQPLVYPEATSVSTSSKVDITEDISIKVRDNWVIALKNSQLDMQHSNGISGTINVSKIDDYGEINIKDDILTPWVNQVTQDNIEYSDIFVDSDIWGEQAKFSAAINEKPCRIQAGLFTYGDSCVAYTFVYKGEVDTTKDEIIKGILNTITVYDSEIITE